MTSADYYTTSDRKTDSRIAHGYGPIRGNGQRDDVTERATSRATGGGAGESFSSAPDLLYFARAPSAYRSERAPDRTYDIHNRHRMKIAAAPAN